MRRRTSRSIRSAARVGSSCSLFAYVDSQHNRRSPSSVGERSPEGRTLLTSSSGPRAADRQARCFDNVSSSASRRSPTDGVRLCIQGNHGGGGSTFGTSRSAPFNVDALAIGGSSGARSPPRRADRRCCTKKAPVPSRPGSNRTRATSMRTGSGSAREHELSSKCEDGLTSSGVERVHRKRARITTRRSSGPAPEGGTSSRPAPRHQRIA